MKQCPTCQSQYTDDTLQFCLQDGSPLQTAPNSQAKTLDYGEQETVVAGRQSNQINAPHATNPTGWNPNQHQSNAAISPTGKSSNASFAVFLTVFVMLLLFSFVGIGAWLYFRGATPDDKGNLFITKSTPYPETQSNRTTTANTTSSKSTPATTPATTSSNANTTTNTAPLDTEQIKRDVSQRVISWKSASESLNLDAHLSHYAPTVDYYNKRGASVGFVRADKQRAFATYNSIQFTLSNMSVTVVPATNGERARAVFDKEWNFSGAEKSSSGKVHQRLDFRKVSGQWLITGERDLKVYYTK